MSDALRRGAGIGALALAALCAVSLVLAGLPRRAEPDAYRASGDAVVIAPVSRETGGTVSVNLADRWELTELPGVGETLADAILAEREAHGAYRYPEDLLAAKGVGPSKLAGFRELLDMTEE